MADEDKDKQVEEEETNENPIEEETGEGTPQEEKPQVDMEAIKTLKDEVEHLKQFAATSAEANKKLQDVANVIAGKQEKGFDRNKFLNEFAYNPEETLEKFYKERSSKELEEIKKEIKQRRVADEDKQVFARLQNEDPDYSKVISNMGKVMNREEFDQIYKSLADNPLRTEIIYSTIKDRLARRNLIKKNVETATNKKAREATLQTAKSEIPSGGTVENKSSFDEERERITKARENFDSDAVLDMVLDGDYERLLRKKLQK